MPNLVIGTAGHIDHGKTALVKALTGIDTDRLKEEKARGITIELGFACLTLPSGINVGLVDVPGHEKFIKNMLAGVTGINLALLVVAADEGVMPQTLEHLDILKLLEIKKIIIIITKTDLVDSELINLVKEEINELLHDTLYQNAPIVCVSALKGTGITDLKDVLDRVISELEPGQKTEGLTRFPLDRVFTLQGFGTVVTGTLFNGEIQVGDILEAVTKKKKARVRSLQIHGKTVKIASAGQRVAANLAGVEAWEIERGDVLATPDWLAPTARIDIHCNLLKTAPWNLAPMKRIRFHQGTKETLGRVFLMDRAELLPGEEAFIQLVLEEPVAVLRGDNYIIRSYSPAYTIGGGRIVEPQAQKHRAKETFLLDELRIKASGEADKLAAQYLEKKSGLVTVEEMFHYLILSKDQTKNIMNDLGASGRIKEIPVGEEIYYIGKDIILKWEQLITREISHYLLEHPLEPGMNKEELRTKYWPHILVKDFNALIQYWIAQKKINIIENRFLAPFGHQLRIDGYWAQKINEVENSYKNYRWGFPAWNKIVRDLNIEVNKAGQILLYLIKRNNLVHLVDDLYLWHELVDEAKEKITEWFKDKEEITVAQTRDLLGITRKTAVPLLEYLDKIRFMIRIGETRKLIKDNDFDRTNIDKSID